MGKSTISEHVGKVFQECRLKNNLTQNQVAELAGMEPRYISQIERGLSKGSIDTLLKLCNAYNITTDVVLYDLLEDSTKKITNSYENKYKRLSKRDKEVVNNLIDYLINN